MTKDELLLAHEGVMQEACNQCRWPLEYEDEETMYTEQCDHCQIDAQLTAALEAAAKPQKGRDYNVLLTRAAAELIVTCPQAINMLAASLQRRFDEAVIGNPNAGAEKVELPLVEKLDYLRREAPNHD